MNLFDNCVTNDIRRLLSVRSNELFSKHWMYSLISYDHPKKRYVTRNVF